MLLVEENDILKTNNEVLHVDNEGLLMSKDVLANENLVLIDKIRDLKV